MSSRAAPLLFALPSSPVDVVHPDNRGRRSGERSYGVLRLVTPAGTLREVPLGLPELLALAESASRAAATVERVERERREAAT